MEGSTMYTMMDAHPITLFIIVAALLVTPLYIFAMYQQGGESFAKGSIIAGGWLVFGATMFVVCMTRFSEQLGIVGEFLVPFVWALPSAILFFFKDWFLDKRLSQRALIGLQLWRAIGAVFLVEMFRGNLPGIFAWPAGVGDILVALVALLVLWIYRAVKEIPSKSVYIVILVGMIDFFFAFFFGFTSSDSPLHLFSHDFPNQVTVFPTGMIPLYLVPYAIFFHTLSFLNERKFGA
ncbi:MAG: hypothetical protein AAF558_04030 [Verrucomicrobiota bacterium]